MISGINCLKNKNYNVSFNGVRNRTAWRICRGTAAAVAALLLMTSCTQKNNKKDEFISSEKIETDSSSITKAQYKSEENNTVKTYYHYSPKENAVNSTNYDWTEKIYPDGSVEIDSLDYKINIAPNGDRTEIRKEQDNAGNTIISTLYPDSSKSVYTEYNMPENEKLNTELVYWKNGNIKENNYYNEKLSDSTDVNSEKIITLNNIKYDEKGTVLSWESNVTDSARNEKFNKYDKLGRLIYDDVKNEQFIYKGSSKTPNRSISVYEGCSRITLYNEDGSIDRIFFESANGIITEAEKKDSI